MIKSSHEINLHLQKDDILKNIPSNLNKIHSDSSINMDLDELNDFKNSWQINNIPELTSKWIIVNNKLYFLMYIEREWASDNIYYLILANRKQIFKCILSETMEKYQIRWNQ